MIKGLPWEGVGAETIGFDRKGAWPGRSTPFVRRASRSETSRQHREYYSTTVTPIIFRKPKPRPFDELRDNHPVFCYAHQTLVPSLLLKELKPERSQTPWPLLISGTCSNDFSLEICKGGMHERVRYFVNHPRGPLYQALDQQSWVGQRLPASGHPR